MCVYVCVSVYRLLDVLEVIAPFKHFGKLRDFMQTQLPAGFPVKIGLWSVYYNVGLSSVYYNIGLWSVL